MYDCQPFNADVNECLSSEKQVLLLSQTQIGLYLSGTFSVWVSENSIDPDGIGEEEAGEDDATDGAEESDELKELVGENASEEEELELKGGGDVFLFL